MIFAAWAARWGVPAAAIAELQTAVFGLDGTRDTVPGESETAVQVRVKLEASRKGGRLFRNNVGAGYAEDGSFLRWGLANETPAMNKVVKSGDLIGIMPVLITPAHVGQVIGRFTSREVKHGGWAYRGTDREVAQNNWAALVNTLGGDACFATGEGTL